MFGLCIGVLTPDYRTLTCYCTSEGFVYQFAAWHVGSNQGTRLCFENASSYVPRAPCDVNFFITAGRATSVLHRGNMR